MDDKIVISYICPVQAAYLSIQVSYAMSVIVLGNSSSSGLIRVTPASSDPDQRSTIFSMITSNSSLSFRGRLLIIIASLNSPVALGLRQVRPLLAMVEFWPWMWWKRSSSVSLILLESASGDRGSKTGHNLILLMSLLIKKSSNFTCFLQGNTGFNCLNIHNISNAALFPFKALHKSEVQFNLITS